MSPAFFEEVNLRMALVPIYDWPFAFRNLSRWLS